MYIMNMNSASLLIDEINQATKKTLLTFYGFKNVYEAKKTLNYDSAEKLYNKLKREYNKIMRPIEKQEKQTKNKILKERAEKKFKTLIKQEEVKKQKTIQKRKETRLKKKLLKKNTIVRDFTNKDKKLKLFYNMLKSIYGNGKTINVIKEGGVYLLNFTFTFTDNFTADFKNIFTSYIQIDSPTNRIDDDDNYKIYINVGKKIQGQKIIQAFKHGITNCFFKPIIEWCETRLQEVESKRTKERYSGMLKKLKKDNIKYFDSGVTEEDMSFLSNKYQLNFEVNTPFQKKFIICKSNKKALSTFRYINTYINHIEHNKIVNLEPIQVTQEELNNKANELFKTKDFITYNRNRNGYSKISTLDNTYILKNDYREAINNFETETGLVNCYLDDIDDKEVSKFVRQGTHFNETIDFIDNVYDDSLVYKHIDMEKAYANFKLCKYYKGFVGRITDFRKCNHIVDVGYYRIKNINFNNANDKLKKYNEIMCIYNNNVYPSFELQFLTDNGVTFDIIEGCWGSKLDFEFNNDLLNNKDNGVKYYAKYVGSMFCKQLHNNFYMRGDETLSEHIKNVSDYDMVNYNSFTNEIMVSYKKNHNNHLSHICGFITSYMRLNMLEQLLTMTPENIIRVCVDGIYYSNEEVECLNCFRPKPDEIKSNTASDTFISNYDCDLEKIENENFIKLVLNRKKLNNDVIDNITDFLGNEYRQNFMTELHKGVGGSGKTHINIYDKGFIRKLFVAPSWKLSRNKNKECGISNEVWANILSTDPEKINLIKKRFNVLIIDEISMMCNESKEQIFKTFSDTKIIMCGDCGYQLPQFNNELTDFKETGFQNIISYNINRRCKCEKLQTVLDYSREHIKNNDLFNIVKNMITQKITHEELKKIYKKEDMILTRSNVKKDFFSETFKDVEKYYILKTDRLYCKGEIVYEKPNEDYKLGVDYEVRNAFTIHSIQGETATHKLFIDNKYMEPEAIYTALSRAKYLNQIYLID